MALFHQLAKLEVEGDAVWMRDQGRAQHGDCAVQIAKPVTYLSQFAQRLRILRIDRQRLFDQLFRCLEVAPFERQ